jgi:hypothetical protein
MRAVTDVELAQIDGGTLPPTPEQIEIACPNAPYFCMVLW